MTTRHDDRSGPGAGVPTDVSVSEPVLAELAEAFGAIPTGSLEREHLAEVFAESRRVQARARRWRRLAPAGLVEAPVGRTFAGVAAGVLVVVSVGVGAGSALGLGPWAPGPATIPASPSVPVPSLTPVFSSSQTPEPGPSHSAKDDQSSRATAKDSGDDGTQADEGSGSRDGKRTTPRPAATSDDAGDDGSAGDGGETHDGGGEAEHEDSGAGDAGEG